MCIPILRYNHIRDMQDSYSVSPSVFEKQVRYLQSKSYQFLGFDDLLLYKKDGEVINKKCILLTFDIAWRDIYMNAYEILKKYNLKAGLFVVTEWVDEASRLERDYVQIPHNECKNALLDNARGVMCNWDEIRAMKDVFSMGSMTHTYQFSNATSPMTWHEDFELSRRLIKERLDVDTKHLAWPDGSYNQGLLRSAKSIGYEVFYTMDEGLNHPTDNNDALKRYTARDSLFWLKKYLFATSSTRNFVIGKIFL